MNGFQVIPAGSGEHLLVVTDVVTIKVSGAETSGRILVMEVLVPPGGGPPGLHRHESAETFHVLEGEFEVKTLDADGKLQVARLTAGDMFAIPSLAWHNFRNAGTTTAKVIAVHSPAGLERFAREIGEPIADPLNPPLSEPLTDEKSQRLMAIIGKYMEILPPDKIAA